VIENRNFESRKVADCKNNNESKVILLSLTFRPFVVRRSLHNEFVVWQFGWLEQR